MDIVIGVLVFAFIFGIAIAIPGALFIVGYGQNRKAKYMRKAEAMIDTGTRTDEYEKVLGHFRSLSSQPVFPDPVAYRIYTDLKQI